MKFRIYPATNETYHDMVIWLYENTDGPKQWKILLDGVRSAPNKDPDVISIEVEFTEEADPYVIPLFQLRWA